MADVGLTDKQRRFCEEYMVDFNGTQAAIRAGYSEDSARQIATENLTKPSVQDYLAALKSDAAHIYNISKGDLIEELRKIAFFDIRKIFSSNNELIPIIDLDNDSAAAISGIESDEILEFDPVAKEKKFVGYTRKLKTNSKIAAIERISKMLGFDAPTKQELSGRDGKPIAVANEHRVIFENFSENVSMPQKAPESNNGA